MYAGYFIMRTSTAVSGGSNTVFIKIGETVPEAEGLIPEEEGESSEETAFFINGEIYWREVTDMDGKR